jgi:hypothetical protein
MSNNKFGSTMHSYSFVTDRIINVRIKIARGYLAVGSLYSPEEGKKEECQEFYKTLQKHINTVNKNDYNIVGGDCNARIGNHSVKDIIGANKQQIRNENKKTLTNSATYNALRITNSLF